MPLINVTVPCGVLSDDEKKQLAKQLTDVVLKVEGAPDTPETKSIAYFLLNEVHAEAWSVGGEAARVPRYLVRVSVPAGAIDDAGKSELVESIFEVVSGLTASRTLNPMQSWIIINEVPDGNWGFGDRIFRLADLAEYVGVS